MCFYINFLQFIFLIIIFIFLFVESKEIKAIKKKILIKLKLIRDYFKTK